MSEEPFQLGDYSQLGLAAAEAALFSAWEALEKFHNDLVVVGGLAVHYHTRDEKNSRFPATSTLDVDFGISMGTDAGLAGTVQFDLSMLGYQSMENGRMFREMEHGTLYIDFLTEHPPRHSGTREVSGISAEVCPGMNRALAVRKYVSIQGTHLNGPLQASRFRYGQNDPGSEGMRLKEDLVTIAHALLDFE